MEFQVASSYTFVLRCGWLCKLLPSFKVDPSFVIKAFWDPWTLQYCAFVCALPLWRGVDKLACHMSGYEQPDSRFLLHHEAPAHRRHYHHAGFAWKQACILDLILQISCMQQFAISKVEDSMKGNRYDNIDAMRGYLGQLRNHSYKTRSTHHFTAPNAVSAMRKHTL